MKKILLVAALLANLAPAAMHTAKADSFSLSTPGLSIRLGDRDPRGYYWDGDRWRNPRWWHERYRWDEGRWWREEQWRRERDWQREREWRAHQRWREHERWREHRHWEHWHNRHGW
ncbi:zinc ABC transporter substrate-binding protein [Izhakiella australiensis]|uniref:Zinc ABC transporter substrate-binding protein n=1 Tax=Izhakiella australiensis TaxID=1926881 RepID=A0A1S8YJD5_9GAMM|nr:DUF2502 domain-containing protein [Izhakiella australiensis]OON39072.1 zinc ABC transporter substrate-binding protein [Izhakiella australiensis]